MNSCFKLIAYSFLMVIFSACGSTNKTKAANQKVEETSNKESQDSYKHVSAGGVYSFQQPKDFGLATKKEQILVSSYIPVCKSNFDYCLYYTGGKYEDTNFGAAGIGFYGLENMNKEDCFSVKKYNGPKMNQHTEMINGTKFTVFSSGGAALGHYANEVIYRTFKNGKCYTFIARISHSQYENYEEGSIEKFTSTMKKNIQDKLKEIIYTIKFK